VAVWIVVLFFLNREYGRAFKEMLSSRWIEPDVVDESMRIPSARRALLQGLRADDESRIVLALKLSEHSTDNEIARAVRGCLRHSSPGVRAAAVEAMEAMRLRDEEGVIRGFLGEPHEGPRRAAIRYLLALGPVPAALARVWLDGNDLTLRQYTVDALFDRPSEGRAALTLAWVDSRIELGAPADLLVAARALGAMTGSAPVERLRTLLTNPDVEVQRVALQSAARASRHPAVPPSNPRAEQRSAPGRDSNRWRGRAVPEAPPRRRARRTGAGSGCSNPGAHREPARRWSPHDDREEPRAKTAGSWISEPDPRARGDR
jgi:hypothetical protein